MQIKTINDYYDKIQELYPQVDMKDIKTILNYGWRSFYQHNSFGGDVCINIPNKNFWCYIGDLYIDSIRHFNNYIKKLTTKFRVLYNRRKAKWDGYYYFALNEEQYQDYITQQKHRGRKRRYFIFKNIFLYKLLDECKIQKFHSQYIFRVKYPLELGFRLYYDKKKLSDVELIITRPPQKFKDILVSNNNYTFV